MQRVDCRSIDRRRLHYWALGLVLLALFHRGSVLAPPVAAQSCSGISGPGMSSGGNCPSPRPAPATRSSPPSVRTYQGGGGADYGAAIGGVLNALGALGSVGRGGSDGLAVCPDGGRVPPGSQCCGNGRYCDAGSICVPGGCLKRSSARVCSDGRRYCEAGSLCLNDGRCLDTASKRVCGNGRSYCEAGAMCLNDGKCLSLSSNRVCANGSYCGQGQMCTNDNRCLALASPQVCGNGRNYCGAGFVCTAGNACLAQTSPRVCRDGRSVCGAGSTCDAEKRCVPDTYAAAPPPAAPSAAPPPAPPAPGQASACEAGNRINVDWVFADAGASRTFYRLRSDQYSDFEALMGAQAHNMPVRDGFLRCRAWVETYLAGKGFGNGETGRVGTADCRCASVVPTGAAGGGGAEYRVSNACPRLAMSVRFIDGMNTTRSSWVGVGEMEMGQAREVRAPVYDLVSIRAVELRRGGSSVVCAMN